MIGNIDDYFEQQGSGPPIVFVHGSYATTSTWKKMLPVLSRTHHCISIKLPGHGNAPAPTDFSMPTVETELAIIEAVVNKLTGQPIHLVGHSYGGVVAISQALNGNITLCELTLFEPVSTWVLDVANDAEMAERLNSFVSRYRADVAQKIPYACGQVIDFWGGDGMFASLPDFIKDGMEPLVLDNIRHWDICQNLPHTLAELRNCQVPTRLVYGTHSNPAAHAIIHHLDNALPNSKRYVIEGASHFLVTSHSSQCLQALTDKGVYQ